MRTSTQPQPLGHLLLRYAYTALVITLSAAAIYLLKQHEFTYSQRNAPISVVGNIDERVVARALAARVPGDRPLLAGKVLEVPDTQSGMIRQVRTQGLWLGVPVVRELLLDSGEISQILLADDGSQYAPVSYSFRDDVANLRPDGERIGMNELNLAGRKLGAGLPQSGYLYFEVPADKLPGMRLVLYEGSRMMPNDNVVVIELGIDKAAAKRLQREAKRALPTFVMAGAAS